MQFEGTNWQQLNLYKELHRMKFFKNKEHFLGFSLTTLAEKDAGFYITCWIIHWTKTGSKTHDIPADGVSQAGKNVPGPTMEYDLQLVTHFAWFQEEG